MKAVVWEDKDIVNVRDIPDIQPADQIIVKVSYAGICGSDLMIKSGKHPSAVPPLVLGHEFAGRIHHIPMQYRDRFESGQRVVVNPLISCRTCKQCLNGHEHVCENLRLLGVGHGPGAFTEYTSVPQPERIHPLPETVSDKEAALIEPLAVAVHAVDRANLSDEDTVLVLGAGTIGLCIALVVRAYGVKQIWLGEIDDSKIKRAERLGFHVIHSGTHDAVEEITKLTNNAMVDVTFDAAGVPQTATQLVPLTATKGTVVVVAIHKEPASVLLRDLVYKELTVLGSWIYEDHHFPKAIQLISQGKVDVKPLITHVLSIQEAVAAFDIAQNGKDVCKVLLTPTGADVSHQL